MEEFYCQRCGKRCTVKTEQHGFDKGLPVLSYWAFCPEQDGRFFADGHTRHEFIGGYSESGGNGKQCTCKYAQDKDCPIHNCGV